MSHRAAGCGPASTGSFWPGQRRLLVGFDDIPLARDLQPALATARVPMAELGARALALALDDVAEQTRTI